MGEIPGVTQYQSLRPYVKVVKVAHLKKKTSTYSHTTRGRSKSDLSSSSRVRLASQPANCPCHLDSYYVWGKMS